MTTSSSTQVVGPPGEAVGVTGTDDAGVTPGAIVAGTRGVEVTVERGPTVG